jgi:hypothetical protein
MINTLQNPKCPVADMKFDIHKVTLKFCVHIII